MASAVLVLLVSYLLGSIPWGYLVGRYSRGVDIRQLGDGNMGAANTYRQIGAWAGISVFLADVAKGAVAIYFARWMGVPQPVILVAGVLAAAGHNWPIFLGFSGGRGISTTIGVLLTLVPREMSILLSVASACLVATHDVILTSILLFVPLPFVGWLFGATGGLIAYCIVLPCLVGFTHYITTRQARTRTA